MAHDVSETEPNDKLSRRTVLLRSATLAGAAAVAPVFVPGEARATDLDPRLRAANSASTQVRVRWWGNNSWELTFGSTRILVDPWVTRFKTGAFVPGAFDMSTPLSWNEDLIRKCFPSADQVLLTHGHFDHITDVPFVARNTNATIFGSETHLNLIRALDASVPDDQLATVRGGEYYQYDGYTLQVFRSLHAAIGGRKRLPMPGTRPGFPPPRPTVVGDLVEGDTLAYVVTVHNGFQALFFGSCNYIEAELRGLRPDMVFVQPGGEYAVVDYVPRLLKTLGFPRYIMPTHWDNYDLPLDQPAQDAEGVDVLAAAVRTASPHSEFVKLEHRQEFTPEP